MSPRPAVPLWKCGVLGGSVLSGLTLVKAAVIVPFVARGREPWGEVFAVSAWVFAIGFGCGTLGGALLGLSKRFGAVGDAAVGVLVMNAFFLGCMAVFARPMLTGAAPGAWLMHSLATAVGLVMGPWIGRDLRKEL